MTYSFRCLLPSLIGIGAVGLLASAPPKPASESSTRKALLPANRYEFTLVRRSLVHSRS